MEPPVEQPHLGAYDETLAVEALDGEVVLTSQSGSVAVALTPDAALETARRLQTAVERARLDRVVAG